MNAHDQKENSSAAIKSHGNIYGKSFSRDGEPENNASPNTTENWENEIGQTLQLGEQLFGFFGGVVDLARVEASLAIRTLPKLIMLWLLMMPIILITWCAFSTLIAWSVFAASGQVGVGILTFFFAAGFIVINLRLVVCKIPHTYDLALYARAN